MPQGSACNRVKARDFMWFVGSHHESFQFKVRWCKKNGHRWCSNEHLTVWCLKRNSLKFPEKSVRIIIPKGEKYIERKQTCPTEYSKQIPHIVAVAVKESFETRKLVAQLTPPTWEAKSNFTASSKSNGCFHKKCDLSHGITLTVLVG